MARTGRCILAAGTAALFTGCCVLAGCSRVAAADPPAGNGHVGPAKPPPGVLALSLEQKREELRKRVQHIIVIYQENWSFDGLYGKFPGADGLAQAGAAAAQVDKQGVPYQTLPRPIDAEKKAPDPRFPADLPVGPFDLAKFVAPTGRTGDLIHRFYHEQLQIDGGKMDRFVDWTDAGGLTMSYYDASDMPEGKLAKQYTLCDHFFHAAFGGSFLNHFWLIAAATPKYPGAPADMIAEPDPAKLADRHGHARRLRGEHAALREPAAPPRREGERRVDTASRAAAAEPKNAHHRRPAEREENFLGLVFGGLGSGPGRRPRSPIQSAIPIPSSAVRLFHEICRRHSRQENPSER